MSNKLTGPSYRSATSAKFGEHQQLAFSVRLHFTQDEHCHIETSQSKARKPSSLKINHVWNRRTSERGTFLQLDRLPSPGRRITASLIELLLRSIL